MTTTTDPSDGVPTGATGAHGAHGAQGPATASQASPELLRLSEEAWESEALPTLSEYTTIRCLSPEFDSEWESRGEIRRAAELLAQWARARQIGRMTVEVSQLPGLTPVLLVDIPSTRSAGGTGGPTLLYGHLDKQPPLGTWRAGLAPFEPVRDGDRLYGRGTADDGYSVFAALQAIEIIERSGREHGHCIVIIEASEESGSPHLSPYLQALADRLGPEGPGLVVCLDSGAMTYDRLWHTTSLRGLVAANLKVSVLTEGIHSGGGGGVVPDSFRLLRALLSRVEDERSGRVLLAAASVEVPPARRAEAEALVAELGMSLDRYPVVEGLRLGNGAPQVEQLLARSWGAALAIVGAEGLPPIADAGNVLRPYTEAKVSIRIPPSADSAAAAEELVGSLSSDPPEGAAVEVGGVVAADGFDAPVAAPWLAAASEAASVGYYGAPGAGMGEGGSIPCLSELQRSYRGAQFLVTGVLGPESNAHGPNEMLHIPTAKRLTAAIAHVLTQVP
jgi:acetylornithine deacetylase/succinyl-diaminopimelate desuccinylase-like protein